MIQKHCPKSINWSICNTKKLPLVVLQTIPEWSPRKPFHLITISDLLCKCRLNTISPGKLPYNISMAECQVLKPALPVYFFLRIYHFQKFIKLTKKRKERKRKEKKWPLSVWSRGLPRGEDMNTLGRHWGVWERTGGGGPRSRHKHQRVDFWFLDYEDGGSVEVCIFYTKSCTYPPKAHTPIHLTTCYLQKLLGKELKNLILEGNRHT